MKKRTKVLIAVGILLVLPIVAIAVVPVVFRDRIVARVKAEINRSVEARVDWRDVGLGLFRDFPNLTLRLDDLTVAGTKRFAGDTLARVGRVQVVLDLASVVGSVRRGATIIVRAVEVDRPTLALRVLEDGTANWDITKPTATARGAATSRPLAISLRQLDIRDAAISLDDRHSRLIASLAGFRQSLKGDFGEDAFVLETTAHADSVSVQFSGIPYLT